MMVPEDEIEIEDVEDALKRADELAELTGRKKTDIVADLLDDGKLNRSAGSDMDVKKDILDIAQEKAEKFKHLITTLLPVLALLMGVGAEGIGILDVTGWGGDSVWDDDDPLGNPPIRWGCMDDNAINYDETAHQDDESCDYEPPDCDTDWRWVDVIIRNADNDGTGYNNDLEIRMVFEDGNECGHHMEGHFSIRIIDEESGEAWDDYQINDDFHNEYTMDEERRNLPAGEYVVRIDYHFHDSFWEGPSTLLNMEEDCTPNIQSNGGTLVKIDANNPDDIRIRIEFGLYDDNACDPSEVDTLYDIFLDGQHQEGPIGQTETISGDMNNPTMSVFLFTPSEVASTPYGDWSVQCRWIPADQSEQWCEDILGPLTIEEPPDPCSISVDNMAAALDGGDAEQDAITISFYLAVDEDTDCTDDMKITYKLEDGETVMQHQTTTTLQDGQYEHTFDDVPVGSWHPIIRVDDENGYELEGNDVSNVDVEEPPRCDITLFDISFAHDGNDTAGVWYDLDCGDGGGDDGIGFNVSIQFDIKIHNTTEILDYNVTLHFIEGYVEDVHELLLHDISNGTYCFNWVAIWTDEEGQQHIITQTWENIEMSGTED